MIDKLTRVLHISRGLLKYLTVGGTAFIVEYGSFYSFYYVAHISLIIANTVSFLLGLTTSFLLNKAWTFADKKYSKKSAHQFLYYAALAIINLLLTNVIVEALTRASIDPKYGKIIAMMATSVWNYILFKVIIFTHDLPFTHDSPKTID